MQTPIGWDAAARRMRSQGKTVHEIAALLGQAPSAVRNALRGTRRPPPEVLGAGRSFVEPHAPRVPRAILDLAVLAGRGDGVRRRCEIDRAELMRRINKRP